MKGCKDEAYQDLKPLNNQAKEPDWWTKYEKYFWCKFISEGIIA